MWGNIKSCPGKKIKSCTLCSKWQSLMCGCREWALTATSSVGLFLFISEQPGIALPVVLSWTTTERGGLSSTLSIVTFSSACDAGWQLEELQGTLTSHQIQAQKPRNRITDGLSWVHFWQTTQGTSFDWTGLQISLSFHQNISPDVSTLISAVKLVYYFTKHVKFLIFLFFCERLQHVWRLLNISASSTEFLWFHSGENPMWNCILCIRWPDSSCKIVLVWMKDELSLNPRVLWLCSWGRSWKIKLQVLKMFTCKSLTYSSEKHFIFAQIRTQQLLLRHMIYISH